MLRRIKKYEHRLSDGRELIYYDDADTKLEPNRREDGRQPSQRPPTARMRQDPLIGDWVSVAVARQNRAFLPPAESDPLAPQSAVNPGAEIPSCYDVAVFENKTPAFGPLLEPPASSPPQGLTELGTIGLGREMTSAWADRTAALSAIPNIQQIFPFGNCGEAVTLHHPHGQIYAYPYITPRTQALIASLDKYGPSLFADILLFEQSGERVVLAGDHWTAFVPFAARWPIEVHILPHRHIADMAATSEVERAELATVYLRVLRGIDAFYADGTPTPYTVAWHQMKQKRKKFHRIQMRMKNLEESVFKKFCTDAPDELDNLFDEVVELKEVVRELEATEGFSKKNLEKKWGEVLKDKNLKHIKTLAPVHVRRDEIRLMCQITSPRRAVDKLKFVAGSEAAMGAWVGDILPELGAKSLREAIQRADVENSVGILPEDIGGIGQEA
uniref:UDP-glucose--hexose-1-phosphate uridylyltransferase n=1 Tax=Globodera pallida TaxID=36090 RepID=A0A183CKJ6_GLOPA